ncbi:hypothetical protein Q1695_008038 [Nippostrongylus brasiliensis]|nr:hypothetical protein Q1695_008038 [Nippostrongylus brasiliensis]
MCCDTFSKTKPKSIGSKETSGTHGSISMEHKVPVCSPGKSMNHCNFNAMRHVNRLMGLLAWNRKFVGAHRASR